MRRPILFAILVLMAGCGDDGGDDDDGAPTEVDAASSPDALVAPPDAVSVDAAPATGIAVTINYRGDAEGTLLAAAFSSVPPQGPPMAFAQDGTPSFPAMLMLEDLDPSTVYVLALLDVPPASPTQPGPEDLTVWSDAITVVEAETATVTLTLEDAE